MGNEIGRRVYYNKLTGDILFDTGQMEGDIQIEPTFEDDIMLGNLTGIDKNIIGCIELKYNEHKDRFSEFPFFKINLTTKTVKFFGNGTMHRQTYNELKNKKEYTKQDIERFYNEYYVDYNLGNLLTADTKFRFVWKNLDELNIRDHMLDQPWETFFTDQYLNDASKDRTLLARDMLENGTYWPVMISHIREDPENLYVFEGNHRVLSAKLLQFEGEWPEDKKLLCIELPLLYHEFKTATMQELLFTPIRQKVPLPVRYNTDLKTREQIEEEMIYDEAVFVDDDTIEYDAMTYTELIDANQSYPHWLRDLFYNYKTETGEVIKPSLILNNEEEWNKWTQKKIKENDK